MFKGFLILSALIFLNAEAAPTKKEILVSAAVSLKDVFNELGNEFETKNNVKISFNYAASGQLRQQIEAGAPVDLFATAALSDMDALETKKLIDPSTKKNFAKNYLVVAQNKNSKIKLISISDLAKAEVKKIALGTPDIVPAGRYAKETLTSFKVYDAFNEKFIFGENVRQVLDYVSKNEVDAGFVYLTEALTDKNIKIAFNISENSHQAIVYPIAVVANSQNAKEASDFIIFITSKSGQEVFKKHGFH